MREDGSLGLSIHFGDGTSGIDVADLAKLLVEVNDWEGLVKVVLNSGFHGFWIVITASTGFSSLGHPLSHEILWKIVIEDLVSLNDVLFEVDGLIDGSWEAINQVALRGS